MTEKEYMKILNGMKEAEDSTIPFAVPGTDEITIVGDPNKTKANPNDFKIMFRVPVKDEDGRVRYDYPEIEYKDVFVTPDKDPEVIQIKAELYPFFKKINDSGGVEEFTDEEKIALVRSYPKEITSRVYDVVASVLGISDTLKPWMMYGSAMEAIGLIMSQYPDMVNESGAFFL